MERDAFISYSHKQDAALAQGLQRGLHHLARPWTRRQTVNVFRDTTSLAASSDLGGSIQKELANSRYFIYLASPTAAASRWVREEIDFWITHRQMDHFLIAVSEGNIAWDPAAGDFDWEKTDVLPEALRGRFATEPLWVNLTEIRERGEFSLRQADFRDAVATLAAPLHGRSKDALDGEDLRQHRLATRVLRTAVVTLALLLVTSLIAGVFAWQQRNTALARARTSASQALAARSLEMAGSDPRKAAQFALYADRVESTGESAQALGRAVAANGPVVWHVQGGREQTALWHGPSHTTSNRVAISQDGRLLAYYSDYDVTASDINDRHINLYDLQTRTSLPELRGEGWPMNGGGLMLSADGKILAVEVYPNQIEIWDVPGRRLTRTLVPDPNSSGLDNARARFKSTALSADGQHVAVTYLKPDSHETVYYGVWNTGTGARLSDGEVQDQSSELSFIQPGQLQVLDAQQARLNTLRLDTNTWAPTRTIGGMALDKDRYATALGNGSWAYVTGKAGDELWDLKGGRRTASVAEGPGRLVVPAEGKGMALGVDEQTLSLYDTTLKRQRVIGSFGWPVMDIATSGDGRWMAAIAEDGALTVFSTTGTQTGAPVANPQQLKREEFTEDRGLALRDVDGGTDVWRVSAAPPGDLQRLGHLPVAISRKPGSTDSVVVTADGTKAAVSQAAKMSLWDLRTGKRIGAEMPIEDDEPRFLSFLQDDVHALVQWKKDVSVVDTRSWEGVQRIPHATDPLLRVGISGDRTTFAFTGRDTTTIWRWSGGKLVKQPFEMPGPLAIHTVAFTRNGAKAAAVDTDGRVHLLDVASGRAVESTSVTQKGSSAVAFSPDGRLLVQAIPKGKDSFLQFWDSETGEARGTWALDNQPLGTEWHDRSVLNDPTGQILTLGTDGSLVRRAIDVASWRRILCGVVSDPLSRNEHDRYLSELDVSAPCPPRT
ncbi:toll/interleukin-1 receptor domain-containing protein [Streptomyces sp. NPDC051555]|uniref:toll/interleukin-1 receptor domain-containing protein n=1 Tax=Streptomyces sp. NPDC051555 TaxID=3365657 RepID=UPI00379AE63D